MLSKETKSLKIYLDLDGVVANFHSSLARILNGFYDTIVIMDRYHVQLPFRQLVLAAKQSIKYNRFYSKHMIKHLATNEVHEFAKWFLTGNEYFWTVLPIMPHAEELIQFARQYDYYFLTIPFDEASKPGKIKWINKRFGIPIEEIEQRIIFEKDKWKYATANSILIDDTLKNVEMFKEHGGMIIHHKSIKDTLQKLKLILP